MLQKESIYNILPKSKIIQNTGISYKSKYPHWIAPTASTFKLHTSSYPNICNLSGEYTLPRGAHKLEQENATFGLPEGSYAPNPNNYHKKGETFKILPPLEYLHQKDEIKKPSIPNKNDYPIYGFKSDKNYIISNAVDNILMQPKKLRSGSQEIIFHKYYGNIPNYIKKYRMEHENELKNIREIKKRKQEEEDAKQRLLSLNEVNELREGLKKKWEMYNFKYGKLTHKKVFDNLVLLRK